jgi:ankyrin repeat protein
MSNLEAAAWTETDILDVERLAGRIAAGADVNRPMSLRGESPLGIAVRFGNVDACRLLLRAGADPVADAVTKQSLFCTLINARNSGGVTISTPAMSAMFSLLVAHGASPDGQTDTSLISADESPVFQAVLRDDQEAVIALAKLGAKLNVTCNTFSVFNPTKAFASPIELAKRKGRDAMVVTLLRLGASEQFLTNGRNDDPSLTPFQACVAAGLKEAVSYYMTERGEDPAQRTMKGRTMAQIAGSPEVKALMHSLKTQLVVQEAVGSPVQAGQKDGASKKGMAPL